ncbi:hypothetical protein [[Clostridium] dakarense]|uniref:hypothetical protein n=1 Tax=Faecalimicrobium dakarense TaxID=1301100 RepID=UPI0004B92C1C|nr:hypothetical protein [[Clostridium] dakarense]
MDKKTIGIIVKNDYDDILYYEDNFFIKIDISKNDNLETIIENKLDEILNKKAFRIEKISKKIPKLNVSNNDNNTEDIVMYLVEVYMYKDNSDFMPKENILDSISISLYRDYFVKYIIRYDKYRKLVDSYIYLPIYIFYMMGIVDLPFGIRLPNNLFDNFWAIMFIYIVLPIFIIEKFIAPSIVDYLINYNISEKTFKISRWLYRIILFVVFFACLVIIYLKQ